jgi:hypothetical protein
MKTGFLFFRVKNIESLHMLLDSDLHLAHPLLICGINQMVGWGRSSISNIAA